MDLEPGQVDSILVESTALRKFTSYALKLAEVKNPTSKKTKRLRNVGGLLIPPGGLGAYVDSQG